LWSSERDGYRHLYLYSIDGSLIRQLTRGDWEVTNLAALDETARRAYYISTQAGPMERHVYSVNLDGGEPRRLTTHAGTHSASISPNTRYMVLTHSSLVTPPSSAIMEVEGSRRLDYLREPATKLLEEYDFCPSRPSPLREPAA
jgi:dipeptidyl-peptidase 4